MNWCDALAVHLNTGGADWLVFGPSEAWDYWGECSCYVPDHESFPPLGQEVVKMTDWLAVVDAYLYTIGGVGAEDALCEACISGRSARRRWREASRSSASSATGWSKPMAGPARSIAAP